jgi:SPW repeat
VSSWISGYADSHPAVANHVAIVFGFGPLTLLMANLRAAALVTLLAGAWLAVSPWLLGYATGHRAWLNELVTGALLVLLCARVGGVRLPRGHHPLRWRRVRSTMRHSMIHHSN